MGVQAHLHGQLFIDRHVDNRHVDDRLHLQNKTVAASGLLEQKEQEYVRGRGTGGAARLQPCMRPLSDPAQPPTHLPPLGSPLPQAAGQVRHTAGIKGEEGHL